MLNTDSTVFVMDNMNINDGYPVFRWQTVNNLALDTVTNISSYGAQLQGHYSGFPDSVGFCYRINGSNDSTVIFISPADTNVSCTLQGLQPNTTYSCRFFAMKYGRSLFSSAQTFTTFPTYTVTVSSNNTAWGTATGSGTFGHGEVDTLTATPAPHYQFTQWSDGNTQNPRQLIVTQNRSLTASFALATHTVTLTSNNTAWGTVSGSGSFNYGQSTLISATPQTGYHFAAWSDGNTDNPRVLLVENDVSLTATFAPNQYTVTLYSNDLTKGTVSGGGTYNYGQQIYIIATPVGNYAFQQWSDGNTNAYRSITVTQDIAYTAFFTEPYFTITTLTNNNQYGTVSGGGSYISGSSAVLTANANTGYHFVQWNDGNTQNPRTVTVTGNATYTAQFATNTYTVTAISANSTMGYVLGGGTYPYMSQATLEATPASHHHFTSWNDGNTTNPRLIIVRSDTVLTALFAIDQHTINVVSANVNQGTVAGGGTYDYGADATFSATAANHYHFQQWNDGVTSNPRTVTVTANATYTAQFAPDSYTLTVNANATQGVVTGGGSYTYGSQATLSVTPLAHYHFTGWSDGSTANPRVVTVACDTAFTAFFVIGQHTINVVSADVGQGTVAGGGTYDYGTDVTISATAANHYHFQQWNDGVTSNPRTVTVTANATYSAQFAPDSYTLTVNANATQGVVTGGGSYTYGSQATLSVTPLAHYHFTGWSDGSIANPRVVTVSCDTSFTALFAIDQHMVTVISSDTTQGTVNGSGNYDYGAQVTISATGTEHYHFQQWNDGVTLNPRIVTVTADATYTAQFAPNSYTLTVSTANNTMGYVSGGGSFVYGSEVTISATPLPHHSFVEWSDGIATNPRTVTVTSDSVITALFSEEPRYAVTVVSDNAEQGSVSGGGSFYAGETASIMAFPAVNYLFDHWSDGNVEALRTVIVTSDATYTAYFRPVTYTVNVFSNDDNLGSVAGGGEYEYGSTATVTATPAAGCRFVRWSNGIEVNPYTFTVYSNVNLIATFERNNGIDETEANTCHIITQGTFILIDGAEGLPIQIIDMVGRTHFRTARHDGCAIKMPASGVYLVRIADQIAKVVLY